MKTPIAVIPDSRLPRYQRGLAAVETAITLPLMLFMLLAFTEFGNAIMQYNELTKGTRDGVRHLATYARDGTTGTTEISPALNKATRNLVVYGNIGGGGDPIIEGLDISHVTVQQIDTDHVRVEVDFPYNSLLGINAVPSFGVGDGEVSTLITLRSSVVMRVL